MNTLIRTFLWSTVAGLSLLVLRPAAAGADHYWEGYWGWYDNTYRPFYYQQYFRDQKPRLFPGPPGGYGYAPYRYPNPEGVFYPSSPNIEYGYLGPGGVQVRVGPLRYGWW